MEGYLSGACVRDPAGETGRILAVGPSFVRIGWDLPHTSVCREEELPRAEDRFRFGVEVLTLDRGWVPLAFVIPPVGPVRDVVAEVTAILESDHDPFKRKSRLGPGPRGGTLKKAGRWSCSGSGYQQTCVGIAADNRGQTIHIVIDPEYKAQYNRDYKRFIRNRRRRRKRL